MARDCDQTEDGGYSSVSSFLLSVGMFTCQLVKLWLSLR